MQPGGNISKDAETSHTDYCTFCHRNGIASYILKETPTFRIVADHAPLIEGHLLIMPRKHFACYGDVPAALDAELSTLKREVQDFFEQFYAPAVFWEHGVFRQTVFHAHLHCFPFGETEYQPAEALHDLVVKSQEDIRAWYASRGHYFYMEDASNAFLFAPDLEHYFHIIQKSLWAGVSARSKQKKWRTPQQRQEEGKALIKALATNWHRFQQQEVPYADKASS